MNTVLYIAFICICVLFIYREFLNQKKKHIDLREKELDLCKKIQKEYCSVGDNGTDKKFLYPVIKMTSVSYDRFVTPIALFETCAEAKAFAEEQNEKYKGTDTRFGFSWRVPVIRKIGEKQ